MLTSLGPPFAAFSATREKSAATGRERRSTICSPVSAPTCSMRYLNPPIVFSLVSMGAKLGPRPRSVAAVEALDRAPVAGPHRVPELDAVALLRRLDDPEGF